MYKALLIYRRAFFGYFGFETGYLIVGVGLADAIIAASAETENAALKTINVKHYPMLKGLQPAYQK